MNKMQEIKGAVQRVRQLPGVNKIPGQLKRWRWIWYGGGILGGVLLVLWLGPGGVSWLRTAFAPPAGPAPLLLASLDAQQQSLRQAEEAVQAEKKALAQEQQENAQAWQELSRLEGRLEEVILARQHTEEELRQQAQELAALKKMAATKQDTLALTNIRKVTKIYSAMKPAALASIIKQLREDLALQILLRMEDRKVAKLFAVLEPAYAARLSTKLNELKLNR
jgi:flagellar motility protein MotE (MotC chaperone)